MYIYTREYYLFYIYPFFELICRTNPILCFSKWDYIRLGARFCRWKAMGMNILGAAV